MENVKPVTVTIDSEVLKALDTAAAEQYRSRSNLTTKILAEARGLARTEEAAKAQ